MKNDRNLVRTGNISTLNDSLFHNQANNYKKGILTSRLSRMSKYESVAEPRRNNYNFDSEIYKNKTSSKHDDTYSMSTSSYQQKPIRSTTSSSYRSSVNSPRYEKSSSSLSPTNRFSSSDSGFYSLKSQTKYLPEKSRDKMNKKTLILDLDETLVHSAFKAFYTKPDIVLNIELERKKHLIHVLKRPGVDEFLDRMSRHYEVVIFTASLSAYANPLINQLDMRRNVSYRLFREHCTQLNGTFIKDMKLLGRDLKDVIIVDVIFILYLE